MKKRQRECRTEKQVKKCELHSRCSDRARKKRAAIPRPGQPRRADNADDRRLKVFEGLNRKGQRRGHVIGVQWLSVERRPWFVS